VSGALFDLSGRVAIVTGSTKGIGRAMAEGLARAGASVVVSSRKQDLCDEVAAEIAAATGATTLALACHVGEWDRTPQFVDAVAERFGRIDVLVNNAGINPARVLSPGPFMSEMMEGGERTSPGFWRGARPAIRTGIPCGRPR
jgi:NAD(P)-dependent dehydrogenase (short-subunit alcohol dehydrogenase family)